MNVEKSAVKSTTGPNGYQDIQSVFLTEDHRKYRFLQSTEHDNLELFRKVDLYLFDQSLVVAERAQLFRHWIGDLSEYTCNVKLGIQSDDENIVKLYWRLINTVFQLDRVRQLVTNSRRSPPWRNLLFREMSSLMNSLDMREVHKRLPKIFERILVSVTKRRRISFTSLIGGDYWGETYGYINHLTPKTCLHRYHTQLTLNVEDCCFLEATNRVSGTRHAMVAMGFFNPILVFLGRVVQSDFTVLDAQSGYSIEMEENLLGVDRAKFEDNIMYSCKCAYQELVKRLSMKESLQQRNITAFEQRFLDFVKSQTIHCDGGSVHYVPDGITKTFCGYSGVTIYAHSGLVSVNTGNGMVANSVSEGVGRLQVFIAHRLRCYFYSDGGLHCVFYVHGGIYVSDDDRRITCDSVNEKTVDNVDLQKQFESSQEVYDVGSDSGCISE